MELNVSCSPDLSNDRRQNDVAGNRKINDDGVVFDAQHWADASFIQGLRSKLLLPSRFARADPALTIAHPLFDLFDLCKFLRSGGADRDRTGDLLLAKQALSQLSYSP